MSLTADTSGFRASLESIASHLMGASGRALRAGLEATLADAKATDLFKDRTGETRGSFETEVETFARGSVRFGGASRLLDSGTAPHMIEARGAALRFEVAGDVFFRRVVRHPGTAPRPFIRHARDRGEAVMLATAELEVNALIRRGR